MQVYIKDIRRYNKKLNADVYNKKGNANIYPGKMFLPVQIPSANSKKYKLKQV